MIVTLTEDMAEWSDGGAWYAVNNTWNQADLVNGRDFTQSVTLDPDGFPGGARFEWDWPTMPVWDTVRSYPEVLRGLKPWDLEKSTDDVFPVRIAEMGQMELAFRLDWSPDDPAFNVAVSFWINDDPAAGRDGITHEVMVWLKPAGFTPAGVRVAGGETALGGWDLWVNEAHEDASGNTAVEWSYAALRFEDGVKEGVLDIDEVMDVLLERGFLESEAHLMNVELGAEVVEGRGWLEINALDLRLRDTETGGPGHDRIEGTDGADLLRGRGGRDVLAGGAGDDVLRGGRGSDRLAGGSGEDDLRGGRAHDELRGGAGEDELRGGRGRDELRGGGGDDMLRGGRGDDVLWGGRGDDRLEGGSGENVFVFRAGSGNDVIRDFALGQDRLDVEGAMRAEPTQGGTLILHDGGTVLLAGLTAEPADLAPFG